MKLNIKIKAALNSQTKRSKLRVISHSRKKHIPSYIPHNTLTPANPTSSKITKPNPTTRAVSNHHHHQPSKIIRPLAAQQKPRARRKSMSAAAAALSRTKAERKIRLRRTINYRHGDERKKKQQQQEEGCEKPFRTCHAEQPGYTRRDREQQQPGELWGAACRALACPGSMPRDRPERRIIIFRPTCCCYTPPLATRAHSGCALFRPPSFNKTP